MNNLACQVRNYLGDDSAVDREVSMILGVVFAIALIVGIGYFAWNFVSGKAQTATDLSNQENPGAGNEFSGNPLGN